MQQGQLTLLQLLPRVHCQVLEIQTALQLVRNSCSCVLSIRGHARLHTSQQQRQQLRRLLL
jgi:hypothetical protein